MRAVWKAVKQNYSATPELLVLLSLFRSMLNECIRIGLETNVTSMRSLSSKTYQQLSGYNVLSYYKACASLAAAGILRHYRRAKRKNPSTKMPYCRREHLTTCFIKGRGFKIHDDKLWLPIRPYAPSSIPLSRHTLTVLAGSNVRSVTLTARTLSISFSKEAAEIEPHGLIGIDRNLNNVTTADSSGHTQALDLSEATRIKARYRETKRHMKRKDARVRRGLYGKYGRIQRNKVQQILHHASKLIVERAKRDQYGIVMENIKNIRRLYRKGNWQGKKYRATMNSWSYAELQRQIEYKARWEGIPVMYVSSYGTSSRCSICGSRMARIPEENRKLQCLSCGYMVDRDVNAAKNILARGARLAPVASPVEAMVSVFDPSVDGDELTLRQVSRATLKATAITVSK